jgi:hypothetical protein
LRTIGRGRIRGVPGRRRVDQFVERDLVGAGQRQEQLQGRLAAARLEPGQRADRDAGRLGQLGQGGAPTLAQRSQPRADRRQHRRLVVCHTGKITCQSRRAQRMVGFDERTKETM